MRQKFPMHCKAQCLPKMCKDLSQRDSWSISESAEDSPGDWRDQVELTRRSGAMFLILNILHVELQAPAEPGPLL
jgi:hypothetical protein